MTTIEKQLRRQLMKQGYGLQKSKKPQGIDNLGGYMIIDPLNNSVVRGSRFELTDEDVQEFINELTNLKSTKLKHYGNKKN